MNALVLVGGQGTRLRPLTFDIPKPMLTVVGRPMIFEIVEWLAEHGVTKVVFALGYQSDAFVAAFASGGHAGVEVITATEPEPRDTAGAIAYAADLAGVADGRLIVVNGDILTDLDVGELVAFHDGHEGGATIALTPVDDPSAFGVVPTDGDGRVVSFIEKPKPGEAPTNMINAGTYVLEPSVIARIPRHVPVSIERQIFPDLVSEGELFAIASDSYWLDTGTPDRYLRAQRDVLVGLRPRVILPDHVVVAPGIHLAPDAEVKGEIHGASFFGSKSHLARTARVDDSVVESRVVIEEGARLTDCVIMAGAVIGASAVLERCIVGPDAVIGSHSILRDSIVAGRCHLEPDSQADGARISP